MVTFGPFTRAKSEWYVAGVAGQQRLGVHGRGTAHRFRLPCCLYSTRRSHHAAPAEAVAFLGAVVDPGCAAATAVPVAAGGAAAASHQMPLLFSAGAPPPSFAALAVGQRHCKQWAGLPYQQGK